MQQELDSIVIPTLAENPFMKNDKKISKSVSSTVREEKLTGDAVLEEPRDDTVEAIKKNDLTRELSTVLQNLRKNENSRFNDQADEKDADEKSCHSLSSSEDEECTCKCEDDEDNNIITENEEEEISAL